MASSVVYSSALLQVKLDLVLIFCMVCTWLSLLSPLLRCACRRKTLQVLGNKTFNVIAVRLKALQVCLSSLEDGIEKPRNAL